MHDPRRTRGAWSAAALLAAFLAAAPAPAQDKKPAPPGPEKVLLRLKVREGDRFRFGIQEDYHSVLLLPSEIAEDLSLGREGEILILKVAADGGAEAGVRFSRSRGSVTAGPGNPPPTVFDSADKAVDRASVPPESQALMECAGRGLDLTLSPRGEVTDLHLPADGSPSLARPDAIAHESRFFPLLRSELQRLFTVLPEKEIGAKGSWTVKHDEWRTAVGDDMGPFTEKFTLSARPEQLAKAQLSSGEPKRPYKTDLPKGPTGKKQAPDPGEPKGFDRGPFDLELKGTLDVNVATGMLDHRRLDLQEVRKEWKPNVPPLPSRITYSCEVTCGPVPPK